MLLERSADQRSHTSCILPRMTLVFRTMNSRILMLLYLLFLQTGGAFALNLNETVLDFWNKDKGLPQNAVYSITQTKDGYLWFGTEEGLARYDGVRFTLFNRRNLPFLKHNFVLSVREASDGSLWMGTFGGGVARWKGQEYSTLTTKDGLKDDIVTSVYQGSDGSIWISTMGGLSRWKENQLKSFHMPSRTVSALVQDTSGNLWVATDLGLV